MLQVWQAHLPHPNWPPAVGRLRCKCRGPVTGLHAEIGLPTPCIPGLRKLKSDPRATWLLPNALLRQPLSDVGAHAVEELFVAVLYQVVSQVTAPFSSTLGATMWPAPIIRTQSICRASKVSPFRWNPWYADTWGGDDLSSLLPPRMVLIGLGVDEAIRIRGVPTICQRRAGQAGEDRSRRGRPAFQVR